MWRQGGDIQEDLGEPALITQSVALRSRRHAGGTAVCVGPSSAHVGSTCGLHPPIQPPAVPGGRITPVGTAGPDTVLLCTSSLRLQTGPCC